MVIGGSMSQSAGMFTAAGTSVQHMSGLARGAEVGFSSRVQGLLADGGGHGLRVTGVRVDDTDVSAGSVIVTSGGMAQNRALVERYYPDVLEAGPDLFAISGPGSRGDHVAFAGQAGADMVGRAGGCCC